MDRTLLDGAAFRRDWARFHPACPPLGWVLRYQARLPWVRFHALPDSKRYADSLVDREIILSRANALGDVLLGDGEYCWVVEADVGEVPDPENVAMTARETGDPDEPEWSFYARLECWQAGAFDAKLLSIAEDEPRRAIWMRSGNGAVFAPYDGGFDLFPASWTEVADLRAKWPSWLSAHPEGL